ncbi:MAG TPA: hypothetical protein VFU81_04350, partial [Thermomicrobiales bacterium]|nr:hypothetical protein [Thermomicrobiales bacterium]
WAAVVHWGSAAVAAAGFLTALVLAMRAPVRPADIARAGLGGVEPILIAALVGALALTIAIGRPERNRLRNLIATSAMAALILALTLAAVWTLIDDSVRDVRGADETATPVLDQGDVDAFLATHLTPAASETAPYRIPTGVLLESIEFLSANNVRISGYIWQKWPRGVPPDIARGVELPEAVEGSDLVEPTYERKTADGSDLIGWHVQVTLRQAFDYHRYPFDRQDVWLRMWSRDFTRRVVLVPDFASYPIVAPAALPGLDPHFVYAGWTPEHAHFSFDASRAGATVGESAAQQDAPYPELFFNVGLKRDFLEPFLDYVIFSLVVALLLFGILVLTKADEASKSRFGISTFGILGSSGTLLFAVILKHAQLRGAIGPDQIVYLETLPGLLYVGILLVALNAILLVDPPERTLAFLRYRNNLAPALLFWPALLGVLLIVTLFLFGQ